MRTALLRCALPPALIGAHSLRAGTRLTAPQSPRRAKTSAPGDAPSPPPVPPAAKRAKKAKALGRFKGASLQPVNQLVPVAKAEPEKAAQPLEPGLASWDAPQGNAAAKLAQAAQPARGWKKPSAAPAAAPAPPTTTAERAPSAPKPAPAPAPAPPAAADYDELPEEPDWDEIAEMEREAAEAQSYIDSQQEAAARAASEPAVAPNAEPQAEPTAAPAAQVAAADVRPEAAPAAPAPAKPAPKAKRKAAPPRKAAAKRRRAPQNTPSDSSSESECDCDSDGAQSAGRPAVRDRRSGGRAGADYAGQQSDSGSDTSSGSEYSEPEVRAARQKRRRQQKKAAPRGEKKKAPKGAAKDSKRRAQSDRSHRPSADKRPAASVPKASPPTGANAAVAAAPAAPAPNELQAKHARTQNDPGPEKKTAESAARPKEKVVYDQLGRKRVKWKPPVSTRGVSGEVSQNFRRLGNVNKKSTNRELALRNGGRGRGRGGRGRGGRGGRGGSRGRGSKWTGSNSWGKESSSYRGTTSDTHSAAFAADPYGVMHSGRLGTLLVASPGPHAPPETEGGPATGGEASAPGNVDTDKPDAGRKQQVASRELEEAPDKPRAIPRAAIPQRTVDEKTETMLLNVLQKHFGHDSFRDGQAWAIDRVLRPTYSSNQSTLAILPTGAGKSLCYQVASFLLRPKVTLVISPLVSLMQDQLLNLPAGLRGHCISSNQKYSLNREAMEALSAKKLDILYIAPERLYDMKLLRRLGELGDDAVGLVCIDEAHCVSQWSHNFRPSYLRLDLVMRRQLGIRCPVLGLTATATATTERSVREKLNIPKRGVWRSSTLRPNLHLTVSIESDRRGALVTLLKSPNFEKAKSIIVYAFYRADVDELSRYLQGQMISADGYHAGKDAPVREKIQNDFMSGKLRVVVATVAFGMGINKQDVGGVIHYSLPGSMESYVQEVGRAGRDGNAAYCHLFLNTGDYMRRRSLASSDGLDRGTVLTSLRMLFSTNICKRNHQASVNAWTERGTEESYTAPEYAGGWNRLVSCTEEQAKRDYDTTMDVLTTCFTYLEIGNPCYLRVLSLSTDLVYSVRFYKSTVEELCKLSPVVHCIVQVGKRRSGKYEFDVATVCNLLRMSTDDLVSALRQLKSCAFPCSILRFCLNSTNLQQCCC